MKQILRPRSAFAQCPTSCDAIRQQGLSLTMALFDSPCSASPASLALPASNGLRPAYVVCVAGSERVGNVPYRLTTSQLKILLRCVCLAKTCVKR